MTKRYQVTLRLGAPPSNRLRRSVQQKRRAGGSWSKAKGRLCEVPLPIACANQACPEMVQGQTACSSTSGPANWLLYRSA